MAKKKNEIAIRAAIKKAQETVLMSNEQAIVDDNSLSSNDKMKKLIIRGVSKTIAAGKLGLQFQRAKNVANNMLVTGHLINPNRLGKSANPFTDEDEQLFKSWYKQELSVRVKWAKEEKTLYPSQILDRISEPKLSRKEKADNIAANLKQLGIV